MRLLVPLQATPYIPGDSSGCWKSLKKCSYSNSNIQQSLEKFNVRIFLAANRVVMILQIHSTHCHITIPNTLRFHNLYTPNISLKTLKCTHIISIVLPLHNHNNLQKLAVFDIDWNMFSVQSWNRVLTTFTPNPLSSAVKYSNLQKLPILSEYPLWSKASIRWITIFVILRLLSHLIM